MLLAVKPQMMDGAVKSIAQFATPGTLLLSIAAGKTLAYFGRQFGEGAAVIRAMSQYVSLAMYSVRLPRLRR